MSISIELQQARIAANLTQAQLAERSQLTRMTVGRAEAGHDLQLSTVNVLARSMGMELMLVPSALRGEVEGFVRSGGRLLGQSSGIGAPPSVMDLLRDPPSPKANRPRAKATIHSQDKSV